MIRIIIVWIIAIIICALLLIGGWHLLAPEKWHWISQDQQVMIFLLGWLSGFAFIVMGAD